MTLFNRIWDSVKKSVLRFPAATILSAAACIFFSIEVVNPKSLDCSTIAAMQTVRDRFLAFGMSSCWAIIFSIAIQLVSEIATEKHGSTVKRAVLFICGQCASVFIGLGPGYLFCRHTGNKYLMIYFGTMAALTLICPYLLSFFERKETVVPHIICALFFAGIIATSAGVGMSIIFWAMNSLIHNFNNFDEVMEVIWICSELFIFVNCFISFATNREEPYSVPKFFKMVFLSVLFPLYLALIVVLYVYLVKCIAVHSLPQGMMNWFVSFATIFYLLFYFTLRSYENKVTSCFFSFGAAFLVPLVVAQVIAFAIRVKAYGFTSVRWVSLMYILLSIWFIVMSFVQKGKHLMLVFPVAAIIALLITCTPFNVMDMPMREQTARMMRVLVKNNMMKDGKVCAAVDENALSNEDKATLVSTFDEIRSYDTVPEFLKTAWLNNATDIDESDFQKIFGITYSKGYLDDEQETVKKYLYYVQSKKKEIPIETYKKLVIIGEGTETYNNNDKLYLKYNNESYDITAYIAPNYTMVSNEYDNSNMKHIDEPVVIRNDDGTTIVLTEIEVHADVGTKKINYSKLEGCLCW